MIFGLPPGMFMILAALLVPLLRGPWRAAYILAVPIAGLAALIDIVPGSYYAFSFLGHELTPVRIDRLSLAFGYIFHFAAILGAIFAFHLRDPMEQTAALIYAGGAIAAVFAGDLISLFVFWELTAISSVFLIWARRSPRAYRAGMRYLLIQIFSGVLLLSGALMVAHQSGDMTFGKIALDGTGGALIFLAFGIKCAFPLLHNWLQDAYPEATVTGTVYLSAFTTKLAIYALARGFPGTELLIYIGAAMAVFPIFYALIENDVRRVLAYSLNSLLGFMVVGVGIGTPLALNGAVGHAMVSVVYQGLLFMSMGAVLYRVGTTKGSELGGLYRSMPLTTVFCLIGAASISAFPLFSSFVAKSLTLSAASYEGWALAWVALLIASAGVFLHSGIKIPYFTFFGQDSGKRCKDAPAHMLIAMGLSAAFCIAIGVWPGALYAALPYDVSYQPYTTAHVINQLQLLMLAAFAFLLLLRYGLIPRNERATNLDFDWVYRRVLFGTGLNAAAAIAALHARLWARFQRRIERFIAGVFRHHGPGGILARSWPTGSTTLWVAVLLVACLAIFYI